MNRLRSEVMSSDCANRKVSIARTPHPAGTETRIEGIAQRLAVDGDGISLMQPGGHFGVHPPAGGMECLGIDHPEHRRECLVQWHSVLELQDISETTLSGMIESGYFGAGHLAVEA